MKILYFDCSNGVSGDMVLNALQSLGECADEVQAMMDGFSAEAADHHHDHQHDHAHGRSYHDVKHIIQHSDFTDGAKEIALNIYSAIARAEAEVHEASLETIHFHEVGRDEAIKNALGIGMALEIISPDRLYISDVYDGQGTIICSHGEIPVPVPAVAAMMKTTDYKFQTAPVDTEMVTPSGLASLIGIGAKPAAGGIMPPGEIIRETEAKGSRPTGRPGLRVYMIQD